MRTSWNDEEDDALQGLPLRAQIIYLRGIRRYMDYGSRVSGGAGRRISLSMLAEITQESVNRQILPKASKDCVRASLEQLKRAGLLQRLDDPDYLVFLLLKADAADKSGLNNHPATVRHRPAPDHTPNPASAIEGLPPIQPATAPAPMAANHPTHQNTGFQDNLSLPSGREVNISTIQPSRQPAPPYQAIVDLYHECLPVLPRVYKLNDSRKRHIKALWGEELEDLGSWRHYFKHIAKSDFLMGRVAGRDGSAFLASFDFIIHPAKFIKIAEEQYHGKKVYSRSAC